ncbi:MAG: nickel pincer cofactor biosynthesis protein LarB [Thermoguttaceae bacterium]
MNGANSQKNPPQCGFVDLGATLLDTDRESRCGLPEVVYGAGKTLDAIVAIFAEYERRDIDGLATRLDPTHGNALAEKFPRGHYNEVARTFRLPSTTPKSSRGGRVVIVSAGTSDLPVAEEARETAVWAGAEVVMINDVGVAGPHRLQAKLPIIAEADVVIVVAGMEGALPSVVGGYVACPVIAVPTSVGYGASFGGLAALLGMLNSCASNVIVVNIDAGFKAGYVAGLMVKRKIHAEQS